MTFWQDKKIRNILDFPLKMEMGNGWFANFADCDARPFISGERLETAGQLLKDTALTALGTRMRGTIADQLKDVPHLTRALDLIFHAPAGKADETAERPADMYLPDLQVRLVRRGGWTLACKGGHNGENHNHNDVGSFILFRDGEPAVVDAGNMVYTAKTFSAERYTLWNVRAEWHNLPIIGEYEQREGAEHAARNVKMTPDGMEMNLEGTYDAETGIRELKRSYRLSADGLRLTDEGTLKSAQKVTWVFLLRCKPAWDEGRITAGSLAVKCPDGLEYKAEEIPVTDPRMARSWPGSLWRVLLRSGPAEAFRAEFLFTAKKREAEG